MNFLQETRDAIQHAGQFTGLIKFIGSEASAYHCAWSEFRVLADFDYDPYEDEVMIPFDLVILFDNGFKLIRGTFDGSCDGPWCWKLVEPFRIPDGQKIIRTLLGAGGCTLAQVNSRK